MQIGAMQIATMQIGAMQIGTMQIATMQIGTMQIGTAQRRCANATPRRVRAPPLASLALLGGFVLALACSDGAVPTEPDEPDPTGERPAMRVRPSSGGGEVMRFENPERPAEILAAFERLRPAFEADLAALGSPGFAWALVIDEQLAATGAAGRTSVEDGFEVSPQTVFRIGSITKVFTALAAVQLRDRGLLALDEPMLDWLPAFEGVVYPTADSALITPRHLMTHTSGLPRLSGVDYTTADRPPSEAALLAALDGVELERVPGQSSLYSNFGVSLLGPLVHRVSGQPYEQYIRTQVLQPLEMHSTYWDPDVVPTDRLARPHVAGPEGQPALVREWAMGAAGPAGGLYSSVEDLARFAAFSLSAWPARNSAQSPVLSRASLRESQQPQVVDQLIASQWADGTPLALLTGNGLGWAVQRDCQLEHLVWHNGGTEGHRAALYLLPQRGVALMAAANLAEADVDRAIVRALRQLDDSGALSRRTLVATYTQQWRRRVNRALAFDERTTEQEYQALFVEDFVEEFPLELVVEVLATFRGNAAHCEVAQALDNGDADWSAAVVACDDMPAYVVEAALAPDGRIAGIAPTPLEDFEEPPAVAGSPLCPVPTPDEGMPPTSEAAQLTRAAAPGPGLPGSPPL